MDAAVLLDTFLQILVPLTSGYIVLCHFPQLVPSGRLTLQFRYTFGRYQDSFINFCFRNLLPGLQVLQVLTVFEVPIVNDRLFRFSFLDHLPGVGKGLVRRIGPGKHELVRIFLTVPSASVYGIISLLCGYSRRVENKFPGFRVPGYSVPVLFRCLRFWNYRFRLFFGYWCLLFGVNGLCDFLPRHRSVIKAVVVRREGGSFLRFVGQRPFLAVDGDSSAIV
ncbi:MAG: hypothetical protein SPK80_01735 [Bacteroidales bacterium]|nr:hypothetical protein [Bacteroidales bacterium]